MIDAKTELPEQTQQPDFVVSDKGLRCVIVMNLTRDVQGLIEFVREQKLVRCPPGSLCEKFFVVFLNGVDPKYRRKWYTQQQLVELMTGQVKKPAYCI